MLPIMVEQKSSSKRLESLGVFSWPVLSYAVSEFPCNYDQREVCYLLEGKVMVTTEEGASVELEAGDLVVFPAGLSCHWNIEKPLRKHYRLG